METVLRNLKNLNSSTFQYPPQLQRKTMKWLAKRFLKNRITLALLITLTSSMTMSTSASKELSRKSSFHIFKLSEFQLLSLHVLGSGKNLMLVSPTGSGKTNVIYLGTLLMQKILNIKDGVAIITEPLNMIMAEKLSSSIVPTGVISMTGELKASLEEKDGVKLSAPEESFLDGSLPCLFGHPESWLSEKGRESIKKLYKRSRILMMSLKLPD